MSAVRAFLVPLLAMAFFAVPVVELGYAGFTPSVPQLTLKPDHAGFVHVNGANIWYGIFNARPDAEGRPGLEAAAMATGSPLPIATPVVTAAIVLPQPARLAGAAANGDDTVILLHGGLGSSLDWRNQIPALVDRHRVVVIDSRGQGRSSRNGQPISYDLMMSDVIGVMDRLKIDKAAFAGWSDGGIIALDIAIHHPRRITRLFTYGANFNPDGLIPNAGESFIADLRIRVASLVDEHAATVRDVTEMWNEEPDFTPSELGSIRVPTMIADGAREEAIKPEHTRALAEMIPDAELAILPNVGHSGLLEDPKDFNTLLAGFLDHS